MHLCLFEDDQVQHLSPLVLTRPVYDLRIGMRTLGERIVAVLGSPPVLLQARSSVAAVAGAEHERVVNRVPGSLDVLFVNGRWFAEEGDVAATIRAVAASGKEARLVVQEGVCLAAWIPGADAGPVAEEVLTADSFGEIPVEEVTGARFVSRLWHPLDFLVDGLRDDFTWRTRGYNIFERPGARIHDGAMLFEPERVFVAPGAVVKPGAVLSAEEGPVYIDEHAIVMENAVVRGPAYVGPHSQVKIGGNIEATALGPWCKMGGEVEHTIVHSYSSKAHAGFLGHSYLGRWCNLGADTNNSNLKNDYGKVSLYNPVIEDFESTDRQFLGLIMGDHSKCSINTMFNTGTVVDVFCNIYGAGFPPRHVPSFAWGTPEGFVEYRLEKALRVAEAVMARRNIVLTENDRELLGRVFEQTRAARAESAKS